MDDTTVSIIGIIIASILMFIVPLVLIADRSDDISQLTVQTETSQFVDTVIKTGRITMEDYQNYITGMASTGNTYEIDIEIKILDENVAHRKTNETGNVGENAYYSIYSSQVEDLLQKDENRDSTNLNGKLVLKEGDIIIVIAKNSSKTLSQTLKNIYYTISGEEVHIISASSSGTIAINGAT